MKTQLLKKLSSFLPAGMAFITLAIFSVAVANAQIIYTNVEPDLKFMQSSNGSTTYNLDLNKDSITDLILTANTTTSGGPRGGRPVTTRRVLAATAAGSNLFMVKVNPSSTILVPNGLPLTEGLTLPGKYGQAQLLDS